MSSDTVWNYGVLIVVAVGCLGLVIRFFRRELGGQGRGGVWVLFRLLRYGQRTPRQV